MNMKLGFSRSVAAAIIRPATLGLMACSSSDQAPPTPKVSETTPPVAQPAPTPDAAPAAAWAGERPFQSDDRARQGLNS